MAYVNIVFRRVAGATSPPIHIVFGADVPTTDATGDFTLPGPSVVASFCEPHDTSGDFTLPLPEVIASAVPGYQMTGDFTLPKPVVEAEGLVFTSYRVDADGLFYLTGPTVIASLVPPHDTEADFYLPYPTVAASATFDSNVQRPLVGYAGTSFQVANHLGIRHGGAFQQTKTGLVQVEHLQSIAQPLAMGLEGRFQDGKPLPVGTTGRFQDTERQRTGVGIRWQVASPRKSATEGVFQKADRLEEAQFNVRWQVMYMDRRPYMRGRFQQAKLLEEKQYEATIKQGIPVTLRRGTRFQKAMKPRVGVSTWPHEPVPDDRCYIPNPDIVFRDFWAGSKDVVFFCGRHRFNQWVIPTRRIYVMLNDAQFYRVSDSEPLAILSARISLDSWTWGLDATLAWADLEKVEPTGAGPVEIAVVVNGHEWRFLVEDYRETQQHSKSTVSITGRSLTAGLDEPYSLPRSWVQTMFMTSKEIGDEILSLDGIPLGYDLDWNLAGALGWDVPANTWSYQSKTPIAALKELVDAVGGRLYADPMEKKLYARSAYPVSSWDWGTTAADIVIPKAVMKSMGLSWTQKPEYNAIHVSGEKVGVQSIVTRSGTGGDILAPMYSHALLSEEDAVREYGRQFLSQGGKQATVTFDIPLSAMTGLIMPGKLLEITGGTAWKGMSRGVTIALQPMAGGRGLSVNQSLTVERHY